MGYMRHHTIVVTAWDDKQIEVAHKQALTIFGEAVDELGRENMAQLVTPILGSMVNGYRTFVVVPDGSKEWWGTSDAGDAARAKFIEWLDARRYEDGSTSVDWVEVQFGDEERQTIITSHSDEHRAGLSSAQGDGIDRQKGT